MYTFFKKTIGLNKINEFYYKIISSSISIHENILVFMFLEL